MARTKKESERVAAVDACRILHVSYKTSMGFHGTIGSIFIGGQVTHSILHNVPRLSYPDIKKFFSRRKGFY